jgi:hypothetical protein
MRRKSKTALRYIIRSTVHAHKIIHTQYSILNTIPSTNTKTSIMPFDDTNKAAEAEIQLGNDHYLDLNAKDFSPELVAQSVVSRRKFGTKQTDDSDMLTNHDQNSSTPSSTVEGTGQAADADMVTHNVQHKKNVVVGVAYGVLLGAVLLGPIGAVAGGFGGRAVVRRRERRWGRRQSSVGEATSSGGAPEEECVVGDVIASPTDNNDTSTTTTRTADAAFIVVTE